MARPALLLTLALLLSSVACLQLPEITNAFAQAVSANVSTVPCGGCGQNGTCYNSAACYCASPYYGDHCEKRKTFP